MMKQRLAQTALIFIASLGQLCHLHAAPRNSGNEFHSLGIAAEAKTCLNKIREGELALRLAVTSSCSEQGDAVSCSSARASVAAMKVGKGDELRLCLSSPGVRLEHPVASDPATRVANDPAI